MAQEHPDQAVPPVQPQPVITPTRPPAYAQAPVRPLASPSTPNAFASPASPTLSTPNFSMPAVAPTPKPAPRNENRDALHAVLKEYGVDPYREPAD
jgi:hypothetical protein